MKNTTVISLLATLCLFFMILSLSVFAIWSSLMNQQATDNVRTSLSVTVAYRQLLYAFNRQDRFQDEYFLHPNPTLYAESLTLRTTITHRLGSLENDANANDNRAILYISSLQQRYQQAEKLFFSAIDAGHSTNATTILHTSIDPLLDQILTEINQQEALAETQVSYNLARLSRVQTITSTLIPPIFSLGVLLIGVSFYASRSYSRKIDESAQAEIALLERVVSTDTLTGLGNHYAYHELLSQALASARDDQSIVIIALIDIDDFKLINEEGGYQYADEILVALAGILQEEKLSDALFRLSGDDFALITSSLSQAEAIVGLERFCQKVQQHPLGITVSIGVTVSTSGEPGSELLHTQATAAVREAKRRGRNRVLSFEAIAESVQLLSPTKARAIRSLLHEGKMSIAFQPIWNLSTGTLFAFEALARPSADYGFSGPQEMFDVAEQMGRAHELDLVCVRAILAHAADLPPDVQLFINITPQTLIHDLLTGTILLSTVIEAGLDPSRIVLEITERSIANLVEVVEKAKHLQLLGFQIALDDAGAGNAGLEMLSQLSLQFVKIDRAIVSNALTDQSARSVFAGITTIARESHTLVIAEGIETPEMLKFVREAYGQYVQGYLLGRPSETISQFRNLKDLQNPQDAVVFCPLIKAHVKEGV